MQVAPINPVLQALSGAQEVGHTKPQPSATKVETARAVTATEKSEAGNPTQMRTRREPEDDDSGQPKRRGSIVDIVA